MGAPSARILGRVIATAALVVAIAACSSIRPRQNSGGNWLAAGHGASVSQPQSMTVRSGLDEAYRKLPLAFEANQGQSHPRVDFLARGSGYTLFLARAEAVLALETTAAETETLAIHVGLKGASSGPIATPQNELRGKVNYLIGNDPRKWRTAIPTYASVHYHNIYPAIDLAYSGLQGQLRYDFIVKPGGDTKAITLDFRGIQTAHLNDEGDLEVHTTAGTVRQRRPFIYQNVHGIRRQVPGGYVMKGPNQVGFDVGDYDETEPLIIDPTLVYSTYLGGSVNDFGGGIAVDTFGNAYVVGATISADFPTTPGAFDRTFADVFGSDIFVSKLDPTGSVLVYSTYIGGTGQDEGLAVAVDQLGSAYLTGLTTSADFPVTLNAYDTVFGGGGEAFMTKLDPTGSMLSYSTYLGIDSANGYGISVDAGGAAYVTGLAIVFPVTPGAVQPPPGAPRSGNAFVAKIDPSLAGSASLLYGAVIGGDASDVGRAIAVDGSGNAYITGQTTSTNFPVTASAFQPTFAGGSCNTSTAICGDAFVVKLNQTGSALVYSTYLGGTYDERGAGIAVDNVDTAYVSGSTFSSDFPTTPGGFQGSLLGVSDIFVTKLDSAGDSLVYSTYLGGSGEDGSTGIVVDAGRAAIVTGSTLSSDYPTTPDALQTGPGQFTPGVSDVILTKLNVTGSDLSFSTYISGDNHDSASGIALHHGGDIFLAGSTHSSNFSTPGALDTTRNGGFDAFVLRIAGLGVSPPASVTLDPTAAINPVDTQHCITATVDDAFGNPVQNVTVRFEVTGSTNTSGSATTDANGKATFCYNGPSLPGADVINAYADTDDDGVHDTDEPFGVAEKTWVLPVSTPACEITITNGGWIFAANGDRANFGGNAMADANGHVSGKEEYQDHGPVQPMNLHGDVLAVVCSADSIAATIFGQATIDGSGSHTYRVDVKDLGEPGRGDTYRIQVNIYDSGEQTLEGGDVQIRR